MLTPLLEKIIYHYVTQHPDVIGAVQPRFFDTPEIRVTYEIFKEFYGRYSVAPSLQQMLELAKLKGLADDGVLTDKKLEIIYDVQLDRYEPDWLKENVHAWVEFKDFDSAVMDLNMFMKATSFNTENYREALDKARSIISERAKVRLDFELGISLFDPAAHRKEPGDVMVTGFPFLDAGMGGGYRKKTLTVLVAPKKVGKTLVMGNMALNGIKLGYNVAYFSLEMGDTDIAQRVGSNWLSIPYDRYNDHAIDEVQFKSRILRMRENAIPSLGELYIKEFPSGQASAKDIAAHLDRAEDALGVKFDVVFVDYLGIVKEWRNPSSENMYLNGKHISQDLRAIGQERDIAIVTAGQTNRGAFESSDINSRDMAESAAVLHTADSVVGLVQDEPMKADGVMVMKFLETRYSGLKYARQQFRVDYNFMRVWQDIDQPMHGGDFL